LFFHLFLYFLWETIRRDNAIIGPNFTSCRKYTLVFTFGLVDDLKKRDGIKIISFFCKDI